MELYIVINKKTKIENNYFKTELLYIGQDEERARKIVKKETYGKFSEVPLSKKKHHVILCYEGQYHGVTSTVKLYKMKEGKTNIILSKSNNDERSE